MTWRFLALPFLAAMALTSGCVTQGEPVGQISIDRSFSVGGGRWGDGGVIYIFSTARNRGGKVEVCVAHMTSGLSAFSSQFTENVLGSGSITIKGKRVVSSLAFSNPLRSVEPIETVIGKPANCVVTTVDWKPGYRGAEVEAILPRQRFVD